MDAAANPLKEGRSYAEIPESVINDAQLGMFDLLTLLVVRFHDRRDKFGSLKGGHCTASLSTLAAEARLGQSTLRRSLKNLERLGYLYVQPGPKAGRSANVVAINDAYYWREPDALPPARKPRRKREDARNEPAPDDRELTF